MKLKIIQIENMCEKIRDDIRIKSDSIDAKLNSVASLDIAKVDRIAHLYDVLAILENEATLARASKAVVYQKETMSLGQAERKIKFLEKHVKKMENYKSILSTKLENPQISFKLEVSENIERDMQYLDAELTRSKFTIIDLRSTVIHCLHKELVEIDHNFAKENLADYIN